MFGGGGGDERVQPSSGSLTLTATAVWKAVLYVIPNFRFITQPTRNGGDPTLTLDSRMNVWYLSYSGCDVHPIEFHMLISAEFYIKTLSRL